MKSKILSNQILGVFSLKVFGLFAQMLTGIVLARSLGASNYGLYAFPMAVLRFLSIPSSAGFPQVIVRNIAQYNSSKEYGKIKGLMRRANQFSLIFGIALSLLGLLLYFCFTNVSIFTMEGKLFVFTILLLPIVSLNNIRMSTLRGMKKVVLGKLPEIVIRPVIVLVLIITVSVTSMNFTPLYAVYIQIIASILIFVIGSLILKKSNLEQIKKSKAIYESKEWLVSAFPFLFLGVMQVINKQTDIIMLGILATPKDVGIYRAVVNASMMITFVLTSVNMAQAPHIASLWKLGKKEELQNLVTHTTVIAAFGTTIISIVLLFFGDFLLGFIFGEEFREGYTALKILCIGYIVSGFSGSVGNINNMTGHEKNAVRIISITATMNIVLNLTLIPYFGLNGAAFATSFSLAIYNILLVVVVLKNVGINPTVFVFKKKKL